jgi:hypothetical protein
MLSSLLNHEAPCSGAPGKIISCLCFENGSIGDRANGDALRRIEVTFALYTGGGINHVGGPFGDRVGRAFGHARATSNALISNLHCHRSTLLDKSDFLFVLKITLSATLCQMTNVAGLGDFVTESIPIKKGLASMRNP